ncbi:hypothetical protein EV196_101134 [Mariniflexile fucanivorans]|uniref:Lipoprotein n=1 Tax=Mariniflexile fucanivorans TaxID=264023 RepID=A0A4R1RQP4_9FLAO|nr:hypothetical protein [Mariniflexile fucanivorans]TCL68715.1 hypothetical protein EV196_101134 [Mariniflexile fucanivorans]
MKNLLFLAICIVLFSCKGNGQPTDPAPKNDDPSPEALVPNPKTDFVFSGDYEDLLTLELASRITGFEPSKANKMNPLKGMTGEILRYYWENGREREKESTTPNRKNTKIGCMDLVQIKWVDGEADMDSFLDFIDLEKYPDLTKVENVGESAYWNPNKNHLEVYYNGVSFTLQVDISNNDILDKEKTIALAKLIIEERIK